MTRRAGSHFVIGYSGAMDVATIDVISTEINIVGNLVGRNVSSGSPGALLRRSPLRTVRARFRAYGSIKPCWSLGR